MSFDFSSADFTKTNYGFIPEDVPGYVRQIRRIFNLYLDEDGMVDYIVKSASLWEKRFRDEFLNTDPILMHMTMGKAIRNAFGLWEPECPYSVCDAHPNEHGIIDHPDHPDQLSHRIMTRAADILRKANA